MTLFLVTAISNGPNRHGEGGHNFEPSMFVPVKNRRSDLQRFSALGRELKVCVGTLSIDRSSGKADRIDSTIIWSPAFCDLVEVFRIVIDIFFFYRLGYSKKRTFFTSLAQEFIFRLARMAWKQRKSGTAR
jgi:hypothetical protein